MNLSLLPAPTPIWQLISADWLPAGQISENEAPNGEKGGAMVVLSRSAQHLKIWWALKENNLNAQGVFSDITPPM